MNNKNMPIYIALGANLSNPKETFLDVIKDMPKIGIQVLAVSSLWRSPSWPPGQGHPDYLNAAAHVSFDESAEALLSRLHDLEESYGRKRGQKNAPRPLDLDILDFRGEVISHKNMTTPHARMLTRSFVLFPLQEIAPDWRDPQSKIPISDYIKRLPLKDVETLNYAGPL